MRQRKPVSKKKTGKTDAFFKQSRPFACGGGGGGRKGKKNLFSM